MVRRLCRRRGMPGAIAGIACGLLAWSVFLPAGMQELDDRCFDSCFSFRGPRATSRKLVIVGIDDFTSQQLSKPLMFISPELATTVKYLKSQGAAVVGVDLIVPEELQGVTELAPGKQGDAGKLGEAIVEAGNVVLSHWLDARPDRPIIPVRPWRLKESLNPETADSGFVDVTPDGDQHVRRQIPAWDEDHLHFATAMLKRADPDDVRWSDGRLMIGGAAALLDDDGLMRINFLGPPGTVQTVRFGDVLSAAAQGIRPDVDFSDAIVVIGDVTSGHHDYHATPFNNRLSGSSVKLMSGAELLLNVFATLADRAWIGGMNAATSLVLLLAIGAATSVAYSRLSLPRGLAVGVVFCLAWKTACVAALWAASFRLPIAPVVLTAALGFAATFLVRWYRVRNMFGVIKSAAIARALEDSPEGVDLRGEDRTLTVLFCDIRNFTQFGEAHSPHEIVALLNTYFAAIVPIIERHGGALNQYMGDGIMVLYGAPNHQADHALRAVRTAVNIVECVRSMSETWGRLDFPEFRIGVGVHTGRAVVGTVGSPSRLDYTAIGDVINTAARIEAETKSQRCDILIGDETCRELSREDRTRLGVESEPLVVTVKGRVRSVQVYRVQVDRAAVEPTVAHTESR